MKQATLSPATRARSATGLPAGPRRGSRRYSGALNWVRSNSSRKGAAFCMLWAKLAANVEVVGTRAAAVHTLGVKRCSSPWACPVCAPTIGERKAREIEAIITWWTTIMGGSVVFVTATVRHRLGWRLRPLLKAMQGSWSATWRFGRGGRPDFYAGQIRVWETPHGKHGWHPHIHSAIFINPGHDGVECVRSMAPKWERQVNKHKHTTQITPAADGKVPGWDVRPVVDADGLGWYLNKVAQDDGLDDDTSWGAGLELARADLKRGKGLNVWQLLDLAIDGDRNAAELWDEYERATTGLKRIFTSRELVAGAPVEVLDDEEAAIAGLDDEIVVRVAIPGPEWDKLVGSGWLDVLRFDVAQLATGQSDGWPWPPDWLVFHNPG